MHTVIDYMPWLVFAVWFMLFPQTVKRFYSWLNRRPLPSGAIPRDLVIRVIGGVTLLVVVLMALWDSLR